MSYADNKVFMTEAEQKEYRRELDVFANPGHAGKTPENSINQAEFKTLSHKAGSSTPKAGKA